MNTPSMLCVEDALDGLRWAERIGGLPALVARSEANFQVLAGYVASGGRYDFLARDPATRSTTSICLKVVSPWFLGLDEAQRAAAAKRIAALLEREGVAYDIAAYRDAPPGLHLNAGVKDSHLYGIQDTIAGGVSGMGGTTDIQALVPWLTWAHDTVAAS